MLENPADDHIIRIPDCTGKCLLRLVGMMDGTLNTTGMFHSDFHEVIKLCIKYDMLPLARSLLHLDIDTLGPGRNHDSFMLANEMNDLQAAVRIARSERPGLRIGLDFMPVTMAERLRPRWIVALALAESKVKKFNTTCPAVHLKGGTLYLDVFAKEFERVVWNRPLAEDLCHAEPYGGTRSMYNTYMSTVDGSGHPSLEEEEEEEYI